MAIQAITAFEQVANNAQSTLAEDLTDVETDIDVASGASFPAPVNGYYATIWDADTYADPALDSNMEIVRVTGKATNTLTVTRAQRGTSGVAHLTGNTIRMLVDSELISDLQDAVNFLEGAAGNSGFRIFEDCMGDFSDTNSGSVSPNGWARYHVGGLPDPTSTNVDTSHPGIYALTANTGTNDLSVLQLGRPNSFIANCRIGGGAWVLECLINLSNLSDGTNEYDFRFGIGTDVTSGAPTSGVFIEYDRNNSVNWHACTISAGSPTRTDTTVAVAATSWTKLRIEINAAASSITYYINGTSVATVTTTIPTGVSMAPFIHIIKSAGGSARTCYIDYLDVQHRLTTAR